MIRKNLIELMVALAATATLCGHASAADPQHTEGTAQGSARQLEVSRNVWLECVRGAIPRVDHLESTSDAVARAALSSCSGQYADLERVLGRTLSPTCGRDADCTRDVLAKAQRDAMTVATDEVMTARIRVAGAQVLICQ